MKRLQGFLCGLHSYTLAYIASVLTIAQIILAFFLQGVGQETIKWVGWICVWVGGIFGVLPVITFRLKGGVPKGKSYTATTILVDSGIYAIVRHPQNGTAWLLINLGIMLIAQHWSNVVLELVSMIFVYADTFKADQYCIEKFGDAYVRYIKKVPRVNFLVGIVRYFRSGKKNST